jgi:hypothetical protein
MLKHVKKYEVHTDLCLTTLHQQTIFYSNIFLIHISSAQVLHFEADAAGIGIRAPEHSCTGPACQEIQTILWKTTITWRLLYFMQTIQFITSYTWMGGIPSGPAVPCLIAWSSHLPWCLVAFLSSPKELSNSSLAEAVFGFPLVLAGEFPASPEDTSSYFLTNLSLNS